MKEQTSTEARDGTLRRCYAAEGKESGILNSMKTRYSVCALDCPDTRSAMVPVENEQATRWRGKVAPTWGGRRKAHALKPSRPADVGGGPRFYRSLVEVERCGN